jgi:hypothetical protein
MKDWTIKILGFGLMVASLAYAYDYPIAPRLLIGMIGGITGYVMAVYGYSKEVAEKLDWIARMVGLLMVVAGLKGIFQEDSYQKLAAIIGLIGIILLVGGVRFRRSLRWLKEYTLRDDEWKD